MDFDKWAKLLEILVSLLQAIGWPLIALIILLYLRVPLKKFLGDIFEVTLKAGPIETTAKRQQAIEAAASLGAATAISSKEEPKGQDSKPISESTREIAKLIDSSITSQTSRNLDKASILWVDDMPSNNTYERNALEALGIKFTICTSTEDALEQLRHRKYNVVISDMGRPLDKQAGYTLLEAMKKMNYGVPFIIYASGGNKPENIAEALKRGAFGSTSGPQRLFELVIKALEQS